MSEKHPIGHHRHEAQTAPNRHSVGDNAGAQPMLGGLMSL